MNIVTGGLCRYAARTQLPVLAPSRCIQEKYKVDGDSPSVKGLRSSTIPNENATKKKVTLQENVND